MKQKKRNQDVHRQRQSQSFTKGFSLLSKERGKMEGQTFQKDSD
jgi:hypothetical protein